MYSIIGLCIAGGLLAIGILATIFSGIRGIATGNQEFKKIGILLIPFIAYAVAYVFTNDVVRAGIATMIFMMGTMVIAIFFTGFRSTFNL